MIELFELVPEPACWWREIYGRECPFCSDDELHDCF